MKLGLRMGMGRELVWISICGDPVGIGIVVDSLTGMDWAYGFVILDCC